MDGRCPDQYRTLVQRVGRGVEQQYNAAALTVTLQDGPAAGQTVPHVHVHVLPRRWGDFEPNDKVYDAIDDASKEELQPRSHPASTPLGGSTFSSSPVAQPAGDVYQIVIVGLAFRVINQYCCRCHCMMSARQAWRVQGEAKAES